jgi:hypothetical protein
LTQTIADVVPGLLIDQQVIAGRFACHAVGRELLDVEGQSVDVRGDLLDVVAATLGLLAGASRDAEGIDAVGGLSDVQVTLGLLPSPGWGSVHCAFLRDCLGRECVSTCRPNLFSVQDTPHV